MSTAGKKMNRRGFLGGAAGAAAFTIVPSHVLGAKKAPGKLAPSDKINIAQIGVGGRGWRDLNGVASENIVALCDVDMRRSVNARKKFPRAKYFGNFREMLDAVEKDIDAVVVATPDHTHAIACMAAIERGKHVYCEKPLAHSVGELRKLRKAALEKKVITQVGNQGHSSDHIRLFCEWVWAGAIGEVKTIHAACNAFKNVYCQINKLQAVQTERPPVPKELDWDLWQGPVKHRPYHGAYVPWNWRGWTPYGTGCIGDWICHVVDPSFWALDLGSPTSVLAKVKGYDPKKHHDVYPPETEITFEFSAKNKRGPVTLIWHDGNGTIPRPKELGAKRRVPGTGAIVLGTTGAIMHGSHGAGGCRIIPEAKMKEIGRPEQKIPRVKGHHWDWLNAIRQGTQAGSSFEYGGALTEIALLGMIGIRFAGTKLLWDADRMQFTNSSDANQYVVPPYHNGYKL